MTPRARELGERVAQQREREAAAPPRPAHAEDLYPPEGAVARVVPGAQRDPGQLAAGVLGQEPQIVLEPGPARVVPPVSTALLRRRLVVPVVREGLVEAVPDGVLVLVAERADSDPFRPFGPGDVGEVGAHLEEVANDIEAGPLVDSPHAVVGPVRVAAHDRARRGGAAAVGLRRRDELTGRLVVDRTCIDLEAPVLVLARNVQVSDEAPSRSTTRTPEAVHVEPVAHRVDGRSDSPCSSLECALRSSVSAAASSQLRLADHSAFS